MSFMLSAIRFWRAVERGLLVMVPQSLFKYGESAALDTSPVPGVSMVIMADALNGSA